MKRVLALIFMSSIIVSCIFDKQKNENNVRKDLNKIATIVKKWEFANRDFTSTLAKKSTVSKKCDSINHGVQACIYDNKSENIYYIDTIKTYEEDGKTSIDIGWFNHGEIYVYKINGYLKKSNLEEWVRATITARYNSIFKDPSDYSYYIKTKKTGKIFYFKYDLYVNINNCEEELNNEQYSISYDLSLYDNKYSVKMKKSFSKSEFKNLLENGKVEVFISGSILDQNNSVVGSFEILDNNNVSIKDKNEVIVKGF